MTKAEHDSKLERIEKEIEQLKKGIQTDIEQADGTETKSIGEMIKKAKGEEGYEQFITMK